jgi:DNA-binding response OmpR family regulator
MQLLVVEDEPALQSLIARALTEEGHRVRAAGIIADARVMLALEPFDLLIVDRNLPDGDGLAWIREIRARGDLRPTIVLTARDSVRDRVDGLYAGADDYLGKPFSIEELAARIAALGRRTGGLGGGRIEVGPLTVDTQALRAWRSGQELALTAQEFRLLRYMAEHKGRVLTRSRLLEAVWDLHDDPASNVVDVYVGYLRHKLDRGHERALLHTVRGMGYVLEDRP